MGAGVPAAAFFSIVALAQCALLLVHGQSQEGFISIDCGIADGAGYTDPYNEIAYVPDAKYVNSGVSRNILSRLGNWYTQYQTLRSFPEGIRNCYRLSPVRPGGKYLVRAGFYHGNYDGKNSTSVFDLHIGVNLWKTVGSSQLTVNDAFTEEIITVAPTDSNSLSVCLVNTGHGVPFISMLELRPLSDTMYLLANQSQSLVLNENRWNYGASSVLRYPEDTYDRIWFPISTVSNMYPLSTTQEVKRKTMDEFEVPTSILRTAFRLRPTYYLPVYIREDNARAGDSIYVVLHFAEIELLMPNETRQMDIYEGEYRSGRLLYGNYSPPYLLADALDVASGTLRQEGTMMFNLSIDESASSTRPAIINARETYLVRPMHVLPTHHGDVEAMEGIKSFYNVTRNWMGDPCAPENFTWDGVNCISEASTPPRVIRLNLTSSGLDDGIPESIANLTALATLDLSNNSLTGAIPDFLAELPSLKLLILTGNEFTGTIPRRLCEKEQNAALSIRIEATQVDVRKQQRDQ